MSNPIQIQPFIACCGAQILHSFPITMNDKHGIPHAVTEEQAHKFFKDSRWSSGAGATFLIVNHIQKPLWGPVFATHGYELLAEFRNPNTRSILSLYGYFTERL